MNKNRDNSVIYAATMRRHLPHAENRIFITALFDLFVLCENKKNNFEMDNNNQVKEFGMALE